MPRNRDQFQDENPIEYPEDGLVPVEHQNTENLPALPDYVFDYSEDVSPIEIGEATQAYGVGFPLIKPRDTLNRRITVYRLRPVRSNKPGVGYYYFCHCSFNDDGSKFNTIIGGKNLIETIETLLVGGVRQPISFIPRMKVSASGNEYWYAE